MSDRVIYAIMLLKGADKYFFLFDATSFNKLTDQMIKYARDPELNFTWHDFGMLLPGCWHYVCIILECCLASVCNYFDMFLAFLP